MNPTADPVVLAFSQPFLSDRILQSFLPDRILPTVVEASPHVAAVLGILALFVLGGVLAVRDRFGEGSRTVDTPEDDDERTSDPERIRELVEENGGRMRQSEIVAEVEWSKAKVSRLLSDLESDEEITKLRIGRENLICLPGEEPAASRPVDAQ